MSVSGKRMYGMLKKLNFVRLSAHEGELKGASVICDEIKSIGYEPEVETFKVPYYEIKKASLEVTSPFTESYTVDGIGFSGNGAAEGLEGEFLYLEAFDQIDLRAAKDKIVLITAPLSPENYEKLIKSGALAFMTTSGTLLDTTKNSDLDGGMLRSQFTCFGQLPGVRIRINDAVKLVSSKPERVRITLAQEEREEDSRNVITEIKGSSLPDEVIVFTAHYDSVRFSHGMFDNGSGSVMLLELLRCFSARAPRRTVRFIWCGSEERGLLGSKAYVAAHENELEKIRLCVNIDMAGTLLGRDWATVTGEEKLCGAVEYYYRETGYPMSVKQDIYSSDSIPFADKGIPGINFLRQAAPGLTQIHCRHDTISTMYAGSLARTTGFVASFTERLINSAFFPVERKIPDNIVEKIDKYLRKKK